MEIFIEVVNNDAFVAKTKKNEDYTYYEVTYKERDGKVKAKKILPFGDPGVFAAVKKLVKGDKCTIVQVKEGEYWNWKEIKSGHTESPPGPASKDATQRPTYVPDDIKQRLIVRQSCLANASRIAAAGGMTHENAMQMAEDFCAWVFEEQPKPVQKPKKARPLADDSDLMDDDIPF